MNIPENSNTASPLALAGAASEWESRYRAGDTPWDKGLPHPALVSWLGTSAMSGHVLVPGCGSGHDVRAIAEKKKGYVIGMDIAPSAFRAASAFTAMGDETYILGDFLAGEAMSYGPFDWIFEHTCFCAIRPERRVDYVSEAAAVLKTGGFLLAVFFMNPVNSDSNSPPFASTSSELDELFLPAFQKIVCHSGIDTYAERENRESLVLFQKR